MFALTESVMSPHIMAICGDVQDQKSIVADPLFVDAENGDHRLKSESPAFRLGFEKIPVDEIGLYKDELRASWPIVEAEGARGKPLISE